MLPTSRTHILYSLAYEPIDRRSGTASGTSRAYDLQQLLESGNYIDVGKMAGDGLVHLVQKTVAAAWIVASGTECSMSDCYLIANINAVSSYRLELKCVFRSLKHLEYLNVTPGEVRQWCNNEQSVIRK